ncbi:MAG: serine O-acetyltransferase EpsC [Bacillota bacterium]|nr:serine O-acetyltransferase EpsC [Bacillota bacterium]
MSLYSDAKNMAAKDPAAKNVLEVILLYAGFHAIVWHRIAHFFYRCRLFLLARLFSQLGRFFTGIEIHPGAKIGKNLFIDHGMGIVIGETAEIGDNCTLYHGVTLGGTGKDVGKRHPTIGDNVLIGAGAKVLGPFTVGEGSMIGANSVVLREIPPHTTVTGIPGRAVKQKQQRVPSSDLNQIDLPDPVMTEFIRLHEAIDKLEKRCEQMEKRS